MADEINLTYRSGATLTYGAFQPDGTVRTAAGTNLPEVGATGYYVASDSAVVVGDQIVVKEGVNIVAGGQYEIRIPTDISTLQTTANTISTDVGTTNALLSGILATGGRVNDKWSR
jgi:hypothetical protein